MTVLASALPGVRELRAPATAGYLWLLLLWLIVDPDLDKKPSGDVAASLYSLGSELGLVGIGVAVSVVAYLLGAISQEVSGYALGRILEYRTEKEEEALKQRARDTFSSAWSKVSEGEQERLDDEYQRVLGVACEDVVDELMLPPTLLVGSNETIFAEVDRLEAEGDFRTAIVPPLTAVVAFLALAASPIWALALSLPAVLAVQGIQRATTARRITATAIVSGRVESPALQRHERWLGSLPRDPLADLA